MTSPLDADARDAAETYIAALDEALTPQRILGVYLTGSAALDDWRPGHSDLDLLAVTADPLTAPELEAVAELHAAIDGAPHCDAIYVTRSSLTAQPDQTYNATATATATATADVLRVIDLAEAVADDSEALAESVAAASDR